MKIYQRVPLYAAGGLCTEIFFTSMKNLYISHDLMLRGDTQLWMVLIYASGGLLFEQLRININNKLIRVVTSLVLLYIIEYSSGWLLLLTLGACPWHYKEPGNIHGLVQLWYAPLWLLFVTIADSLIYYTLNYELILK